MIKSKEYFETRVPRVRERLRASKSGYVLVRKFSQHDRGALGLMIENGEAEIFDSALGRAYRLKNKEA